MKQLFHRTYIGVLHQQQQTNRQGKIGDITQKCLIAFYAKREILKISQRNLQDRAPNASWARLKFDTEIESLAGTRRAPAGGFAPGW